MKLIYNFENIRLDDMLYIAFEFEAETGMAPLFIEENSIYYSYTPADIELLKAGKINADGYRRRNRLY